MNEPVVAFDVGRMLFGEEPPLFLLEIAVRTLLIYAYTFVLIRWVGARPIAQLSLVELLLVIALGSAVGDAMFYPEVPLVHCIIVITVVILMEKGLSYLVANNAVAEDVIEGKTVQIIKDGVLICPALKKQNFGHDELFEQLRLKDVENLAEVRAAYLETNGSVSVFKAASEKPGLSIVPPWDVEEPARISVGTPIDADAMLACEECGKVEHIRRNDSPSACMNCSGSIWHPAAKQPTVSPPAA